ncbi:hypothetical protein QR680_007033 [Steinernema hermaphroditum]|uniref:Uncharacterized protein n=1 Tax=Steinernema hermaphroditum TaxID=289476 RepID=A0AA39HYJ4_9BILA|nr:hypothetical protein QR680_007033 [Steinernema hermaphroditum]
MRRLRRHRPKERRRIRRCCPGSPTCEECFEPGHGVFEVYYAEQVLFEENNIRGDLRDPAMLNWTTVKRLKSWSPRRYCEFLHQMRNVTVFDSFDLEGTIARECNFSLAWKIDVVWISPRDNHHYIVLGDFYDYRFIEKMFCRSPIEIREEFYEKVVKRFHGKKESANSFVNFKALCARINAEVHQLCYEGQVMHSKQCIKGNFNHSGILIKREVLDLEDDVFCTFLQVLIAFYNSDHDEMLKMEHYGCAPITLLDFAVVPSKNPKFVIVGNFNNFEFVRKVVSQLPTDDMKCTFFKKAIVSKHGNSGEPSYADAYSVCNGTEPNSVDEMTTPPDCHVSFENRNLNIHRGAQIDILTDHLKHLCRPVDFAALNNTFLYDSTPDVYNRFIWSVVPSVVILLLAFESTGRSISLLRFRMTQKKKTEGGSRWKRFRVWLTRSEDVGAKKPLPVAIFQRFFPKKAPQPVESPPCAAVAMPPLAEPPQILPQPPPQPPPHPPPQVVPSQPPSQVVPPEKKTEKRTEGSAKRRRESNKVKTELPPPTLPPPSPKTAPNTKSPKTVEKTVDTTAEKKAYLAGLANSLRKFEDSLRRRKRRSRETKQSEESVDQAEESGKTGKGKRSKKGKNRRRRKRDNKTMSTMGIKESWKSLKERSAKNWAQVKKRFVSRPCNPASMNKAVDRVLERRKHRKARSPDKPGSSSSSSQVKEGDVRFPTSHHSSHDAPKSPKSKQMPISPPCAGITKKKPSSENSKTEEKVSETEKVELVKNSNNNGSLFDVTGRPFWQQRGKGIHGRCDVDDAGDLTDDELPLNADLLLDVHNGKIELVDMPNVEIVLDPFAPIEKLHERDSLFFVRDLIYSNTARSMIHMNDDYSLSENLPLNMTDNLTMEYNREAGRIFHETFGDFIDVPIQCIVVASGEVQLVHTLLNAGSRTRINYNNMANHSIGRTSIAAGIVEAHMLISIYFLDDARYNIDLLDFEYRFRNVVRALEERWANDPIATLARRGQNGP